MSDETKRRHSSEELCDAIPTDEEITMTEQESTKEYRVTVRGQLETTTQVFAVNEAVVLKRVEDHRWTEVYSDFEGDEGSVCEALNRNMALEVQGRVYP